jgi:hypothetical protein
MVAKWQNGGETWALKSSQMPVKRRETAPNALLGHKVAKSGSDLSATRRATASQLDALPSRLTASLATATDPQLCRCTNKPKHS